ncbi:MerC domain-containing protein [Nitratireductor mangrovi]|uniref:MerC domain-containing protein n=1 Tax=Nitratireductor mangrovi TaxID=2599600 RepID=A0A5B8L3D4_9HYPH|nr:MerC family mercury resistance protein [Nitratireductor mangrovi]QDZ02363.2 MerC domain-containing protein [Nitratireductor mangrovi]
MSGAMRPEAGPNSLAAGATALAVAACYGTMLIVAALASLGIAVAIHDGVWAGAVSLFAVLAWASVLIGYRRYRILWPAALATLGAAAVLWAMFGSYHWLTELVGLAALALAAAWDWRLKKNARSKETKNAGSSA